MIRILLHTLAVAASLLLAGCATITTGTTQAVGVNAEPQGADCQFTRDNVLVVRVNPTPGTMQIGKASGGISVLCRLSGFEDTHGAIGSEFHRP